MKRMVLFPARETSCSPMAKQKTITEKKEKIEEYQKKTAVQFPILSLVAVSLGPHLFAFVHDWYHSNHLHKTSKSGILM
jgi:hypothetical protein